jgi:hypothetical protein
VTGLPAAVRQAGAIAVAVLIVAGCDSSTGGHGSPASQPYIVPTGSPGTASGSPGSPAPTSTGPRAADGSTVAACADARCEVELGSHTPIPVPASTRVKNLRVQVVTSKQVTLRGTVIGNASTGSCTGDCQSASINGEFSVTMAAGARAVENGLSITAVDITDGVVILKLEPAP